jgi:endonuclease YncB( thermonuclease family)
MISVRGFGLGLFLLLLALGASAETLTGRVVGVTDGDTVKLLTADNIQHRIRIAWIDAPESRQAFGTRSKQSMSDLACNRQARVDCYKQDRYKRDVCNVFVDGRDVGLEQIKRGMAWHYVAYAKEQSRADRDAYAGAERAARDSRQGLWHDAHPVPPWDWRRLHGARSTPL